MLIADAAMVLVYLITPLLWRNIWLDLCQAVIAISLSGATAGVGGPSNSVAFCSMIVCLMHLLRYNKMHLLGLGYLGSLLQSLSGSVAWTPTPASDFLSSSSSQTPVYGWPRSLLGCHILAQGALTLMRRTLQPYSSPRGDVPSIRGLRVDAEVTLFGESSRASLSAGEGNPDPPGTLSSDGRPPGPSPALREGEKRISNNKRKRKQANQVRSQQPLWAAIGSTKVTFLKEMEQKQASRDAIEAEAANTNQNKDGLNDDFDADRIWITDIRPTEILFRADLASWAMKDGTTSKADAATSSSIGTGIDKTKPFYVRINGADWGSTRIQGVAANGDADDSATIKSWNGEIYGLTPLTKYSCEFVCLAGQHEVICGTSVVTLPAPSAEQGELSLMTLMTAMFYQTDVSIFSLCRSTTSATSGSPPTVANLDAQTVNRSGRAQA